MEIRTLKYFLEIAKEQSITKASYNLHISQPALSNQMRELEEELGVSLLNRTNRKTQLTEEGKHFRQRAEEIVSLVDITEAEYHQGDKEIYGIINIGAGETSAMEYIGNAAKRLHDVHSGLRFNIYSGVADDVLDRMNKGLIDFALLFEPVDKQNLEYIELPFKHLIGLVVRKDNPLAQKEYVTWDDLENVPLILNSRKDYNDEFITKKYGIPFEKLNIVASGNLTYNKTMLVRSGLGCVLSTSSNSLFLTGTRFVPLYPYEKSPMIFAWRKNTSLSKGASLFLEEVKKEFSGIEERII